jgi:hypothetical protein
MDHRSFHFVLSSGFDSPEIWLSRSPLRPMVLAGSLVGMRLRLGGNTDWLLSSKHKSFRAVPVSISRARFLFFP